MAIQEDMDHDNQVRIDRAEQALDAYGITLHSGPVSEHAADEVTDLLSDLFHFCAKHSIDIEECLRLAHDNYRYETDLTNYQPEYKADGN